MNHSLQQQANKLLKVAQRNDIEPARALDALLDYLIGTFEMENVMRFEFNYEQVFLNAKQRNEDLFSLLCDWFTQVTEEMENGRGFLDWFGGVYEEMFQGRSKASALGQFYTPECLCQAMAEIIEPSGRMNDCACGSGRTLLAAYAKADKAKFHWFEAGDIDTTSCKMCALNFMIHGMIGEVKRQDALRQDTPSVIYHINEVRYPIPAPFYSIRIEYPKQDEKTEIPRKETEIPRTHTEIPRIEKKPKEEKKQPIQLTLFD